MLKLAITVTAATLFLTYGPCAPGKTLRSEGQNTPVAISRCSDASIRTFLSGMSQGAGNFPGGTQYVCRRIGEGGSAEVLVYLNARASCGSGGCTLLVLAPDVDLGYVVLGRIRTVWPPIRALASKTHGRYDLVALVAGGGILQGYNAVLAYDGQSYPPGGSSGTRVTANAPLGSVVISNAMAARPQVM